MLSSVLFYRRESTAVKEYTQPQGAPLAYSYLPYMLKLLAILL